MYAEHRTIAVTPQGATLTKKAPGISDGNPELKNNNPINNKIIGCRGMVELSLKSKGLFYCLVG